MFPTEFYLFCTIDSFSPIKSEGTFHTFYHHTFKERNRNVEGKALFVGRTQLGSYVVCAQISTLRAQFWQDSESHGVLGIYKCMQVRTLPTVLFLRPLRVSHLLRKRASIYCTLYPRASGGQGKNIRRENYCFKQGSWSSTCQE